MGQVRPIDEESAARVREVVIGHFHAYTRDENGAWLPDDRLPVLRRPGTGWGDHWVLAWEGGAPYDWPIRVTNGGYGDYAPHRWVPGAQFPPEVFCEPINGVELGLYPPMELSYLADGAAHPQESGGAVDGGAVDEDAVADALGTPDTAGAEVPGAEVSGAAAGAEVSGRCLWWLLCPNQASLLVPHPVLGQVPTCGDCAAKVERLRGANAG